MNRNVRVLLVGTAFAIFSVMLLFFGTPGPDLTMEGPGHWSDWLWLPLLIGAFSCGAWGPGIVLHWAACVGIVAIVFFVRDWIRGRKPAEPSPVVEPVPDNWTPPTAEDFARAFRREEPKAEE